MSKIISNLTKGLELVKEYIDKFDTILTWFSQLTEEEKTEIIESNVDLSTAYKNRKDKES